MSDQPISPEPVEPQGEAASRDDPPPGVDTMPSLEESLRTAELKAAEHHDAWLRAKAETENVRRRAAGRDQGGQVRRREIRRRNAGGQGQPRSRARHRKRLAGNAQERRRTDAQATPAAFQNASLAEINPLGEKFDPNRHQAITMVEADGEPNTVVQVLQKGYLLYDRVIRPALVMVSKAKSQ